MKPRYASSFRRKPESKKRRGAHIAAFSFLDARAGNDGIKTKGEWIPAFAGMTGWCASVRGFVAAWASLTLEARPLTPPARDLETRIEQT